MLLLIYIDTVLTMRFFQRTACTAPPPPEDTIVCGVVQSSVTVRAPKSLEPSEEELQRKMTDTIREAINGDGFEDYFPPDCMLT